MQETSNLNNVFEIPFLEDERQDQYFWDEVAKDQANSAPHFNHENLNVAAKDQNVVKSVEAATPEQIFAHMVQETAWIVYARNHTSLSK